MSTLDGWLGKQGGKTIESKGKSKCEDQKIKKKHKMFWKPGWLVCLEHRILGLETQR